MQKFGKSVRIIVLFMFTTISMNAFSFAYAAKPPHPAPAQPVAQSAPVSMDAPAGWTLYQAGSCDALNLLLRNPSEPLQQLFFFPRFGPVYMTQEQKTNDIQYEILSGQKLNRLDMPVVEPLNPENFVRFIPQVLQMKANRGILPERPTLRVVEPIATKSMKSALSYMDTQTAIVRILFVQDNRLGEGLLALTTVPSPEFRNNPGGGIGMAYMLYGLTAPKGELSARLSELLAAGRSFKPGVEYDKKCRNERAEDSPALLPEGYSLKPVLDSLALAWEKRRPAEDMVAEKKADGLRGVERLYRFSSGEVYEFPLGFASEYLVQPDRYNLTDLRPLPDEPALWQKVPLNGSQAVTKR